MLLKVFAIEEIINMICQMQGGLMFKNYFLPTNKKKFL